MIKKILITGPSGFIGHKLIQSLKLKKNVSHSLNSKNTVEQEQVSI